MQEPAKKNRLLRHLQIPPFLGGREGFAMFYRTNQTLSALALSNRLNLGTRSLAANAGVNDGNLTLCARHSYHGVMRDGMVWYEVFTDPKTKHPIPSIPSSSSQPQQCEPVSVILQRVVTTVGDRVDIDPRPADLIDRPGPDVADREPRFLARARSERSTAKPKFPSTKRLSSKSLRERGSKLAAWRATTDSAAMSAATSGK
jgi:hypothetical protein